MVNTLVIVLVIALCILFVCMGISHYLTKKLVEPIEKLATNIMLVDENNVYEEIRPFVNTIKEQHINISIMRSFARNLPRTYPMN